MESLGFCFLFFVSLKKLDSPNVKPHLQQGPRGPHQVHFGKPGR